jgi:cyclopropane-fatty-acyl-phospholipid synthase
MAKLDQVKKQGFDQRFIRMWEYYLCYCEGGFRERVIGTAQVVLAKPEYRNKKWQ